ncbi:MAG TPA: DUF3147 family protein [Candidatus Deferrimicrobiaceae bacterium]|jgi:hypothetical protein|nr:DUF3147 family protein [Candidatus Deferrimicrobiaceae bacterium]
MKDILLRILIGGAVVSAFAMLGELLKPKSFAGLFGAAPSVSLATLALTVMKEGKAYASIEARSMLLGSIAFILYAAVTSRWIIRRHIQVLPATILGIGLWFVCAFGLWFAVLR